jgi:beta-glucosidase
MNIKKLIEQLTIEEKAALLSGISNWETTPIARLDIPSVVMADGPTGLRKEVQGGKFLAPSLPATCFPLPVTQASTWNIELIKAMGEMIAKEAIDQGVDTILGPGVNIKRSPLGGRNFEYFSEDPYLAGQMGSAFINGVQSQYVGTSLKHFALNNQEFRRMSISAEASMRTMREIYLLPFEYAVKTASPQTIMASYNRINGIYASENNWLLTDLLRREWNYQGLVVSDWGAVVDRVKGVSAGMDLEMPTSNGANDEKIIAAVKDGTLSLANLDKAVTNVLTYIERCLNNRTKTKKAPKYDYDTGHDMAKRVAIEGAVLLKNDRDLLPIKAGQSIAVIGELAHKPRYQGSGSSQVNPRRLVSFTQALDENSISYDYAPGYGRHYIKKIKLAQQIAKAKDVVLIFAGLTEEYESEGFDRKHLNLPKDQIKLIDAIVKVNPNVVLVLSLGSPVVMPFASTIPSILNMYLAGEAFGEAAYDLIFGVANPSGKLAETFPKRIEDHPSFGSFPMGPQQVVYKEGIYVGYRHYDKSRKDVLFPFGHGLSYTAFRYRNLMFENNLLEHGEIKVSVEITNVGDVFGAEVVQLYVGEMRPIVDRASFGLKAFKKVFLKPGETKTVLLPLNETAFRYFDEKLNGWNIIGGDFKILVGSSSRDIRLSDVVYIEPRATMLPDKYKSLIPPNAPENGERNIAYTRQTINQAATFYDARRVSLNGWLLYTAIKLGATKMVPKGISKTVKKMVRQSAIMMPLRQLSNFSGGKLSEIGVEAIIFIIKGKLLKGIKMLFNDLKKHKHKSTKTQIYQVQPRE